MQAEIGRAPGAVPPELLDRGFQQLAQEQAALEDDGLDLGLVIPVELRDQAFVESLASAEQGQEPVPPDAGDQAYWLVLALAVGSSLARK